MRGYLIRIAILAIVLSGAGTARATVPTTMNVQGRLTDDTGSPLPAGFKQMTFKIFDSETGGAEIWSEGTQLVTSDANGLWNADVGANTPLSPSVFADTMRWLEITVNDGVNPSETLPRVRLDTSPYAFQANESMHSATTDTAAHAAHAAYADTAGLSLTVTPDDDWTVSDSLIETTYQRGIVRGGSDNFHYGSNAQTIVNMGVACTTSFDGAGSPNVTIGGGFHNVAKRHWSTISGGRDNVAVGTGSTVS